MTTQNTRARIGRIVALLIGVALLATSFLNVVTVWVLLMAVPVLAALWLGRNLLDGAAQNTPARIARIMALVPWRIRSSSGSSRLRMPIRSWNGSAARRSSSLIPTGLRRSAPMTQTMITSSPWLRPSVRSSSRVTCTSRPSRTACR
jgi:hypothetical protein